MPVSAPRTTPRNPPPSPTWSLVTASSGDLAALRADGTFAAPPELKRWSSMVELMDD